MRTFMQTFKLFLILPLVAILFSCSDDDNPTGATDKLLEDAFTASVTGAISTDFDVSGFMGNMSFEEYDQSDYNQISIHGVDMIGLTNSLQIYIDVEYTTDKSAYEFSAVDAGISVYYTESGSMEITKFNKINSGSITVLRNDDKAFHATFSAKLTDSDGGKTLDISDGYFYKVKEE